LLCRTNIEKPDDSVSLISLKTGLNKNVIEIIINDFNNTSKKVRYHVLLNYLFKETNIKLLDLFMEYLTRQGLDSAPENKDKQNLLLLKLADMIRYKRISLDDYE